MEDERRATMKSLSWLMCAWMMMLLSACDIHQWPETRKNMPVILHLHYETDFWVWGHSYNQETGIVSQTLSDEEGVDEGHPGTSERYNAMLDRGTMRYIVRAYRSGNRSEYVKEFVFTRDISEGYDCDITIGLEPGDYEIVVWSDLCERSGDTPFYDASDFRSIDLQYRNYHACTDYRDGFRGTTSTVSLEETIRVTDPEEADIIMRRPMAKYEFIATDLSRFAERELTRRTSLAGKAAVPINVNDYTVRFYYINYVPVSYSAMSDRLVDSTVGLVFESSLSELSTSEASLGFDYVLLNSGGTSVRVQIGIYDETGERVAMTPIVDVPLRRDHHTVLRGTFMSQDEPSSGGNSGGVGIDPGFEGEYNMWV